jgi:hypothetical protein
MPLFGDSGGPKLKLTRPVMILIGVLAVLLVGVVILVIVLSSGAGRGTQTAAKSPTAAASTSPLKVVEGPGTAVPPTALPAAPDATNAPVPPTAPGGGMSLVTPVATPIPAPTGQAGGGVVSQVTPVPQGGGEPSQLPGGSSGLPWLIPVGVLLLVAVAWWRWRRSRAQSH